MGLDNIPYPIPCKKLEIRVFDETEDIACEEVDGCPFSEDDHPHGAAGYKCGYRGKWLYPHLTGTGREDLAEKCFQNIMSPNEATEFALELNEHADSLIEKDFDGVDWLPYLDLESGHIKYDRHSTKEETIALIKQAANWYLTISLLGCQVVAYH